MTKSRRDAVRSAAAGVTARMLGVGGMLLALSATAADPPYRYELVTPVPVASSGLPGNYWLCSFALNNLGQAAYMWNRRESAAVVWTEVWFFDGSASQLVYSALSSAATRPRCNDLTAAPLSVSSNVGLRDDGLVSFGLTTPEGVVLAYGRPGVGIQGTVKNPLGSGIFSVGPTINDSGRTGFYHAAGGTSFRFGTARGAADGTTSIESVVSLSGFLTASTGAATAINNRNQAAAIFRDDDSQPYTWKLGFSDPSAAPGLPARFFALGDTLEVNPRPGQPSLNEKGIVAFTSPQNGATGDPGRVLAIDAEGGGGLIPVADTTSGRFANFTGFASLNEFNQVAFLSSLGAGAGAGVGVHLGSVSGADPIDVLVRDQTVSTPTYSFTFVSIAALATQSLNDSGQVLFLARIDSYGREALVLATPLAGLTLKQSEVAGCKSTTGTVTLMSPAPAGGAVVALSDTLASATVPATVTIPAGAKAANFTIKTTPVAVSETGGVSVTYAGSSANRPLTVRPMGVSAVSLTPGSVAGSQPAVGKATLECKAGPGPITVELASSNPAVANPVAASIVVPQGLSSANFDIATNPVLARKTASISATANGLSKSRTLTVNPAAAVSPTSLKFGSVAVGQTAGPLNATLTNKGAVPFAVNGISLSGTGASWFAQSNDCPASLAPGASCTIAVTFTPQAVASRTAKLGIATSATATPLSVALSGAGT